MRKLVVALAAAAPLVALAQTQAGAPEGAPAPQGAEPQPYAAPPRYPPPQGQYAPPAGYPPPPPQQYAPPPQYPPPAYPPGAPPAAYQRGPWYIGFGLGGGGGSVDVPAGLVNPTGGTMSFKEYIGVSPTTVAINFKLGATLTPKLLLGGDITAIRSAASQSGVDVALQITNYLAMATWFPMERGLFLRGGLGLSRFTYDVSGVGGSASNDENGAAVQVGVGYAFWLGHAFNLTMNLDFSGQSYGSRDAGADPYGGLPKSSSFWALGLGFDWY